MYKIWTDYIKEVKTKFPYHRGDNGFYPAIYSKQGSLRCPNCGNCTWSIKSYSNIECTVCFKAYRNVGILGLDEIAI